MSNPSSEARHKQRPWLDLGPLLVFFVANWRFGIYVATGALIFVTSVVLAVRAHRVLGSAAPAEAGAEPAGLEALAP